MADAEVVEATVEAPADNQPTREQLEREAAEFLGEPYTAPAPKDEPAKEAPVETAPADSGGQAEGKESTATPPVSQAEEKFDLTPDDKALLNEVRALKEITGTSYKTPAEFFKGYKELQSEFTKVTTSVKPYKQLIDRLTSDGTFATTFNQLVEAYDHPELLEAYKGRQGLVPPDPRQYDFQDPQAIAAYNEELGKYTERVADQRLNARLAPIEQQRREAEQAQKMEMHKAEFRKLYPDIDPDEVLKWVPEVQTGNPIVNLYRAREFGNLESRLTTKIRKDLEQKIQQAAQNQTPASTATPAPKVSIEDILHSVSSEGTEGAYKRYGKEKVHHAIRESSKMLM